MGREPKVSACERARTWAALQPDGELSTIELRLLGAHLDGCPACRRFAETVTGATRLVRETEDEAPACSIDLRLLRRSRARTALATASRAGVAAAAVLAAFSIGVMVPDLSRSSEEPLFVGVPVLTDAPNDAELLRIERADDPHARVGAMTRGFGVIL